MESLGQHLIIELYGCDQKLIDDRQYVATHLLEAARLAKATIVNSVFHKFSPQGVSGVVVIAESHFSIHTWPEYGYCALDIFTCGPGLKTEAALEYLEKVFKVQHQSVMEMRRGTLQTINSNLKKGKKPTK